LSNLCKHAKYVDTTLLDVCVCYWTHIAKGSLRLLLDLDTCVCYWT